MNKSELRQVSTDGFPLLARGGQAEIYDCGECRVIRVAKRPQDFDHIRYEYAIYGLLAQAGLPAPRAYELVEVKGSPAIIMDRLSGRSMLEALASNPLRAAHWGRELAGLHTEVGKCRAAPWVRTTRAKAEWCIGHSQILSDSNKHAVLEMLQGLPDGEALCHGDFHPGNVILHEGKSYVIDWMGASRGDLTADVAHSYLLLRVVPRLPHIGRLLHLLQVQVARVLAKGYLKEMASLIPFDYKRFFTWLVVNAAERTYTGLSSEQSQLLVLIERSIYWLSQGKRKEDIYKLL